jgi:hypothetical protein
MNDISLLEKIRKNPDVLLGKPSASLLWAFITGYQYCMIEGGKADCFVIPVRFSLDLAFQYEMYTASAPMIALELCNGNETAAFYKFYELLDEFLEKEKSSS